MKERAGQIKAKNEVRQTANPEALCLEVGTYDVITWSPVVLDSPALPTLLPAAVVAYLWPYYSFLYQTLKVLASGIPS